jgi:hypothetical protein
MKQIAEKYKLCEGEPLLMSKKKMELLKQAIIDNSEFKEAMHQLEIPHKNESESGRNCFYPISERSIKNLITRHEL